MGNIDGSNESSVSTSNEKSEGKGGKQKNYHPFFGKPAARKRNNEDDTQRKNQDVVDAIVEVPVKQAKGGENERKLNVNDAKDNK